MKLLTSIRKRFLSYRASFHLALGHLDVAIPLYEQELEADPQHISLYPLIAAYYTDNRQYEKAQQILERGLTVDPNSPEINRALVEVFHRTGAPVKRVIPYLRTYFAHKPPPVPYNVPGVVKFLAKLFKPNVDVERTMHTVEHSRSRWDMWAYHVLTHYDATHDRPSNDHEDPDNLSPVN